MDIFLDKFPSYRYNKHGLKFNRDLIKRGRGNRPDDARQPDIMQTFVMERCYFLQNQILKDEDKCKKQPLLREGAFISELEEKTEE